jgi:integrase
VLPRRLSGISIPFGRQSPVLPLSGGALRVLRKNQQELAGATWQRLTTYAKTTDFLFPSMRAEGRKPLCSSIFVADHLRPAAKKAGVLIQDGQRFGLHNLRHSLSNWLVNKAKIEPKTVQGILRHSKIQTTLDLYTQEDSDETRAAQGEFLSAVGMSTAVN